MFKDSLVAHLIQRVYLQYGFLDKGIHHQQNGIALFPEILYIFTIIPSSVDLPTPEPANIPTRA